MAPRASKAGGARKAGTARPAHTVRAAPTPATRRTGPKSGGSPLAKRAPRATPTLRQRAEAKMRQRRATAPQPRDLATQERLMEELQIHQIELEMQNEALQRAQAEVQAGLERYVDLYDFAPVGYFTLSQEGAIEQANLTGASLVGLERGRLGKRPFALFVADADRLSFAATLAQAFAHPGQPAACDLQLTSKDKWPRTVHLDLLADNPSDTCRAAVTDITARHAAEEALRQLCDELEERVAARTADLQAANAALGDEVDERRRAEHELETALAHEKATRQQLMQAEKLAALGRVIGSVAHELNNPLQTITNCAFILSQDLPPDSPLHEQLKIIRAETARLVNLVVQLRELYRARLVDAPQARSLAGLVDEVFVLMAAPLEKGHIRWRPPAAETDVTLPVHADHLKQVFLNLVTNALEAMQPAGGELQVDLVQSPPNRQVGVRFQDTGPGISAEMLGHLFEPFYTTKDKGLGLGLSICHEIVQQHGGNIAVASAPGRGAQFTVWLPLP